MSLQALAMASSFGVSPSLVTEQTGCSATEPIFELIAQFGQQRVVHELDGVKKLHLVEVLLVRFASGSRVQLRKP